MKSWVSIFLGQGVLAESPIPTDLAWTPFERRVPPRRPDQRLAMLKQFADDWSARFIGENCTACEKSHPRASNFNSKIKLQNNRFIHAYQRNTCRYYNPDTKHGGPNPNPKPRRTRRENLVAEQLLGDDDMDIFDAQYMRVSSNPLHALRQIFVGYRKWTERYISECYGERVHKYHTKRLKKWYKHWVIEFQRINPNSMGFPPYLNHFLSGWHQIEDIPQKSDNDEYNYNSE